MFDITGFSKDYDVRKLTETDIPDMLSLCEGNPQYYRYCPPTVSAENLKADLTALPPGKMPEDKYFVGYFQDGHLIALLDLIDGFPDSSIAYIGFFMMDRSVSGEGIGSRIISELCEYLASAGARAVRLCWVEGNPQAEHFWKKNGFIETGVKSRREAYTVTVAERKL